MKTYGIKGYRKNMAANNSAWVCQNGTRIALTVEDAETMAAELNMKTPAVRYQAEQLPIRA